MPIQECYLVVEDDVVVSGSSAVPHSPAAIRVIPLRVNELQPGEEHVSTCFYHVTKEETPCRFRYLLVVRMQGEWNVIRGEKVFEVQPLLRVSLMKLPHMEGNFYRCIINNIHEEQTVEEITVLFCMGVSFIGCLLLSFLPWVLGHSGCNQGLRLWLCSRLCVGDAGGVCAGRIPFCTDKTPVSEDTGVPSKSSIGEAFHSSGSNGTNCQERLSFYWCCVVFPRWQRTGSFRLYHEKNWLLLFVCIKHSKYVKWISEVWALRWCKEQRWADGLHPPPIHPSDPGHPEPFQSQSQHSTWIVHWESDQGNPSKGIQEDPPDLTDILESEALRLPGRSIGAIHAESAGQGGMRRWAHSPHPSLQWHNCGSSTVSSYSRYSDRSTADCDTGTSLHNCTDSPVCAPV